MRLQLTCVTRWAGGRLVEVVTDSDSPFHKPERFIQEVAGGPPGIQLWRTVTRTNDPWLFDRMREVDSNWSKFDGKPIWLDQFLRSQRTLTGVSHLDELLEPLVVEVLTTGTMRRRQTAVPWFTYRDQAGTERFMYLTDPSRVWRQVERVRRRLDVVG